MCQERGLGWCEIRRALSKLRARDTRISFGDSKGGGGSTQRPFEKGRADGGRSEEGGHVADGAGSFTRRELDALSGDKT